MSDELNRPTIPTCPNCGGFQIGPTQLGEGTTTYFCSDCGFDGQLRTT